MCGLFGFSDLNHTLTRKQINRLTRCLAEASAVRGTDATGIAYVNPDGALHIYKRPRAAGLLQFSLPTKTTAVMGHVRMATQGKASHNENNHPFPGHLKGNSFALAHNGVIANDSMLALQHHLPSTKVKTDSYVAVQLLERAGKLDFDALAEMAEQLEGTFSFTLLDSSNTLFFVRGNNPLCIARFAGSGLVCYASTREILLKALCQASFLSGTCDVIPIEEGEILSLNAAGKMKRSTFDTEKLNRLRFVPSFFSAPYGYRGWFSDCDEKGFGNDALAPLLEISHSMGYIEDEIFCLLDAGFCEEEIEEMLLHPSQMQTALAECFYCGYGF